MLELTLGWSLFCQDKMKIGTHLKLNYFQPHWAHFIVLLGGTGEGRVKWIKSGICCLQLGNVGRAQVKLTHGGRRNRLQPWPRPHIENMQIAKIFRLMIFLIN